MQAAVDRDHLARDELAGRRSQIDDRCGDVERIAHADTRIVSLTVTEKGYSQNPATGDLDTGDAGVRHVISGGDVVSPVHVARLQLVRDLLARPDGAAE